MDKGTEFKVLDHGYVKLIDHMGTDESIIEAARMSTGKGFVSWNPYYICNHCLNTDVHFSSCGYKEKALTHMPRGDAGLLEHLYKNKHMTPFEMCELSIEVQAPIFVFREWHRHRTQSYNEFSARYSQMFNLHYVPEADRFLPKKSSNKQTRVRYGTILVN
jgi:thymidylate synthase (FAD)